MNARKGLSNQFVSKQIQYLFYSADDFTLFPETQHKGAFLHGCRELPVCPPSHENTLKVSIHQL